MYSIDKKLQAIDIYKRNFGNITKVCKDIEINRDTFYEWLENDELLKNDKTFKQLITENDYEFLDTGDQIVKELAIMKKDRGMLKFFMGRRHPDYKRELNLNMGLQSEGQKERDKIGELLEYAKQLPADYNNNAIVRTGTDDTEDSNESISE